MKSLSKLYPKQLIKMLKTKLFIRCLFVCLIIGVAADILTNKAKSYSDYTTAFTPFYNYTGSPHDVSNCTSCHTGVSPQNNPVVASIYTNVPASGYNPLSVYTINVRVASIGHTSFGFSLCSLDSIDQFKGTLISTSPRTFASYGGVVGKYITQTLTGLVNTDSANWSFNWTAPAAGSGRITFYAAIVIGDGNGSSIPYSSTSDLTYLANLQIQERSCAPIQPDPIVGPVTVCSNSTVTYSVPAVSGATSYTWDLPTGWTGSSTTNSISATASGIGGNVTVYASNACGNGDPISQPITVVPAVTASISATDATCFDANNASVSVSPLSGTAPFTYSWQPASGFGSSANSLSPGTYTATITDFYGCTVTASATVSEPSEIIVTTTSTPATCGIANGTATANSQGGAGNYTYLWSNAGETDSSISQLSSGTYTVLVTDGQGCTQTGAVTIIAPNAPVISLEAQSNVTCHGSANGSTSVTVTDGTLPYSYSWTPNVSTTDSAFNLSPGNYTIIVTDDLGCSTSYSTLITEPDLLGSAITSSPIHCNGDADGALDVSITGGVSPYTFSWNTNPVQNTSTATGLAAGTYTVTFTDNNGCSGTNTGTVVEPAPLSTLVTQHFVYCYNGTIGSLAKVSVSGGTGNYSYLWNTGQTADSIANIPAGNYSVTITDQNGCAMVQPFTILQPDSIHAVDNSTDLHCYNDHSGMAAVTVTGGSPPYTYYWPNDTSNHSASFTGLVAGNYQVYISDFYGCYKIKTLVVQQPAQLISQAFTDSSVCRQDSLNLGGLPTAIGGTQPYTYSWSPSRYLDNTVSPNPFCIPDSSTIYTLSISDANNCITTSTVDITVFQHSPLYITEGNDTMLWTIGGFDSYQWYLDGSPIQNATHSYFATHANGNYTIEVVDTNGCRFMSEIYSFEVSMKDIFNRLDLTLYPNPVSASLNLKLPLEMMKGNYLIINGKGQVVLTGTIQEMNSNIDVSQLGSGLYTLILEKNELMKKLKFTKE